MRHLLAVKEPNFS